MRQSPEDTVEREEGNRRQQSGLLLSLLIDGSPGDDNLQLLLQFLTTLLESSHRFLHLLLALDPELPQVTHLKEICPRGNNKVVIYISLYHDKCLLCMLELY